MPDFSAILLATFTGLFSGLLLSIPVGPVNLTIMNEGARRGLHFALLVGFGASVMETTYCSIAFTGFASFFDHGLIKAAMEVFSFAFLLFLGAKFLLVKSVRLDSEIEGRLEKKFHPHSAFMTGFVRVLGNPGILLLWIVFSANFINRGLVPPNLIGKSACILGVGLGTNLWFDGLSYAVTRGHKKFSEPTLLKMERGSGIGLLLLGLGKGCQLVWQLAHHHV
jgi:threonine/homoserine/homoserine lactone efflux protein